MSTWCSGKYKNVGVRTLLFSLMLLTHNMTLGYELLFPNLWNGNRTTCLDLLRGTHFLWGSYDINYVKTLFEIQTIIKNLERHLSSWVVWFLHFLHSLPNFIFSTLVISFLLLSNTENIPSPFLLYLLLHLSTIQFLFSLLLPTHHLFSYQVIYLSSPAVWPLSLLLYKTVLKWSSCHIPRPFDHTGST